jgi:hypothetical protein
MVGPIGSGNAARVEVPGNTHMKCQMMRRKIPNVERKIVVTSIANTVGEKWLDSRLSAFHSTAV